MSPGLMPTLGCTLITKHVIQNPNSEDSNVCACVCVSQQYMHIVCSAKKNIVSQWRVGCQWPYNDELLGLAGDPVGNAG